MPSLALSLSLLGVLACATGCSGGPSGTGSGASTVATASSRPGASGPGATGTSGGAARSSQPAPGAASPSIQARSEQPPAPVPTTLAGDSTSPASSTEPPLVEPPRPTAPAPTTAGPLDARALPTPSGWATRVGDGAGGAYVPNGTWVNARDPRSTAQEMLALACRDVPAAYPVPTAALEGTYAGPGGAPGTTVALEFADPGQARGFVQAYRDQGASCAGRADGAFTYAELRRTPTALVDRRHVHGDPAPWLEVVGVSGPRATFVMLQEKAAPVSAAQQDAIVQDLTSR